MRSFFEGFQVFAKRRYPNLWVSFETILADTHADADLETLLERLNAAVDVRMGLPATLRTPEIEQFRDHCRYLRSHLLSFIVETCERFDRPAAASTLRPLLALLQEHDVAIFSTNYDRVIEYACEVAAIPVSDGFSVGVGGLVGEWSGQFDSSLRLAKLHGSVTWYEDPKERDGYLRLDRGYPLPGPDFHLSRSAHELRPLMIVPTLEKEALQEPYVRLLTLLTDTLASLRLLVVIGTSLRDAHLVGLIRARADSLCVLVLGHDAARIAQELTGVRVVPLEISTEAFLAIPSERVTSLLGLGDIEDIGDRHEAVRRLAEEENRRLAEVTGLTEAEVAALRELKEASSYRHLDSLRRLRGVAHPEAIEATQELLGSDLPDVRAAAAGNLGSASQTSAVPHLRTLVLRDSIPFVRVEAALALRTIGGAEADAAYREYLEVHAEDGTLPEYP